jgi:LysR family cyn operon transcriptional activator
MDIQQLRYYLTLADSNSFAKAADNLFISRQGLSKSITILEKELGMPLFYRTSTGVELTESGEIFHAHALRIMDEYQAALNTIQNLNTVKGQHIQYIAPNGFWKNVYMDMFDGFF